MTSGAASDPAPTPDAAPTTEDNDQSAVFQSSLAVHGALPYLFIGSGIARRYLDLPDWEGLLRQFASEVGEDFNFHLATANGNLPAAATTVARAFHRHWWKDDAYAAQRASHSGIVRDDEGGLKVAIAEYISSHDTLTPGVPGVDDAELAEEIALLGTAVVDGVITTNYDSLTDQLFPDFPPYIGQDELLMSDAQFIAETYKIHGAATQPLSLIVTSGDYERFSKRNHYLAAKLLTIFAEHPVIFVGYSLNDEYLNEILDNIATAVGPERLGELGKRIYFVEWNRDPSAATLIEQTSIERGGARLPITRIETHSFKWLWEVLAGLERPFPAAILRELRKHVFRLVTHPEPGDTREAVRAIPIDEDGASDVRVVFGVGYFSEKDLEDLSTISAKTLTREDLEQDTLGIRDRPLDAENVLAYGIPDSIRPSSTTFMPVHKYLEETGRIDAKGKINYKGLKPIIKQLAIRPITNHPQTVGRYNRDVKGKLRTPREVMNSGLTTYFKLESLLLLDEVDFDLDELREVLVEFRASDEFTSHNSYFRKVLCRYDRLRAQRLAASH